MAREQQAAPAEVGELATDVPDPLLGRRGGQAARQQQQHGDRLGARVDAAGREGAALGREQAVRRLEQKTTLEEIYLEATSG